MTFILSWKLSWKHFYIRMMMIQMVSIISAKKFRETSSLIWWFFFIDLLFQHKTGLHFDNKVYVYYSLSTLHSTHIRMLLFATLFSHQEASSCVSPASCLTREISRGFFWDGISLEQNTLCVCAWRFRLAAQWRRGGCVFVFFSGCWFYLPTYQFRGRNTFSWEMTNSKQTKKCCTFDNEDADVAFDDYKRI